MNIKKFALKGINDEETRCCVCGKIELKKVMWLVELDEDGNPIGEEFHCGTTCGSKLLNQKLSTINRVVRNFEHEIWKKKNSLLEWKKRELGFNDLLKELNDITPRLSFAERIATPQWAQMKMIEAIAKKFVENQEITIEIK